MDVILLQQISKQLKQIIYLLEQIVKKDKPVISPKCEHL